MAQEKNFVTVAICTWNRCHLLAQTLTAMIKLRVPAGIAWDVIVVDNNSTDDTKAVTASFGDRLPLRYVLEPELGLCHARNRALTESSAEYIIFTDDDVLVSDDWLEGFCRAAMMFTDAAV